MRPVASDQNYLQNPLNRLLGAEAHIRILRVMSNQSNDPLTASDIAAHAGLTTRGTGKALKRLLQSGFVVRIGGGRRHQYALNRSDVLTRALLKLFQVEKNRYETLIASIKTELEKTIPSRLICSLKIDLIGQTLSMVL